MSISPRLSVPTRNAIVRSTTTSTYAGQTEAYTYDDDGLLIASGDYTLTRDTQNAYATNLTDGTLTQTRSYNNFGEVTQVSDNTFTYELSQRDNSEK